MVSIKYNCRPKIKKAYTRPHGNTSEVLKSIRGSGVPDYVQIMGGISFEPGLCYNSAVA